MTPVRLAFLTFHNPDGAIAELTREVKALRDASGSVPCGRCKGRGRLRGVSAVDGEFSIGCLDCNGTGWKP